ncbi:septum-promoting GTP-binding protein 1 [Tanacetum coccineum]
MRHQQQEGSLYFHGSSKMSHLYRRIFRLDIRWSVILNKVSFFKEIFRFIWDRFLACSIGKPVRYRRLSRRKNSLVEDLEDPIIMIGNGNGYESDDSDLVTLKISLLGDCHIGKTSFMIKYVGDEQENSSLEMAGLNLMDKTLSFGGARIAFSIWDVGGDKRSKDQVPLACKDAVAIFVLEWYMQARKWNKNAIPILIGTKFDDFVRLPPDLQWTIVTQARAYAKVMKATLFFSSATHNINVNKIFKFIMARLFNLPWSLQPNLNLGEPIIDLY